MKLLLGLTLISVLSIAVGIRADGLLSFDAVVQRTSNGSRIEFNALNINFSVIKGDYQFSLVDDAEQYTSVTSFPIDGGGDLELVALNLARYCGTNIMFLTIRYRIPGGADILQYRFQSHAFDATTLQYLASAPVAFEDIAPHEQGLDIGFPYTMPQPYQVTCISGGALGLKNFSIFARSEE